jgi:hypothetical protein
MKINLFITISLIIISFQQDKIVGKYRDNFGSEFIFKSDSTYEYNAASHFMGFWSKGKWKVNNDTIFFKAVPSYDTLRIVGRRDSLILSRTKTPQLISANSIKEIFWPKSSGKQDVYSGKLFFQDNRLYEIKNNGKLITKKKTRSDRIDGEKFDPWYTKIFE